MKLVTWNVNGMRAILKKGFNEIFLDLDADVFCVQETKMQEGQADVAFEGYTSYWNSAVKKGYSGTAVLTRIAPLSVTYGIGNQEHDNEGRVINVEFDDFFLVNVYTPNSQRELARLDYRMKWENAFRNHLLKLNRNKNVIVCGDLNVAHNEIDLANPSSNRKNAGFSDEERSKMTELLGAGFTDTFRYLYPDKTDAYTWWSYMFNARANNVGWRIDYFIVSDALKDLVEDCILRPDIFGSDHCPVELILKNVV
ncbi:MAG: exodeoxyribonuclease III [Eubacteriales bacterium]|nr:exodeoxyribonuclease III [Eubacteriales bacterium]MDD4716491.1 exodeoxyribonuclease III [Eubacteriales bacterium]